MTARRWCVVLLAAISCTSALGAQTSGPVDWLKVPARWSKTAQGELVLAVPGDLPRGASLRLFASAPRASAESVPEAYAGTCREIGAWSPIGDTVDQQTDTGWLFRQGVATVTIGRSKYIGLVAVGAKSGAIARFWALADSGGTYNRYKEDIANAIAWVPDVVPAAAAPTAPPGPPPIPVTAPPPRVALDPAFGQGVSGVYLGLERGIHAGAGAFGQAELSVSDESEIDILFPGGSYRRSLPPRGLASDLAWDRAHYPTRWGTWRQEGDRIIATRGSTSATYRLGADGLEDERGRIWHKLPTVVAVRLDGTYVRPDFRDPSAPRLVLRADGTYEDSGGFMRMLGSADRLVVPDGDAMVRGWSEAQAAHALGPGSGTYTLGGFTLSLLASDGRVWQIDAYVPPAETPPQARSLVISNHALVRE